MITAGLASRVAPPRRQPPPLPDVGYPCIGHAHLRGEQSARPVRDTQLRRRRLVSGRDNRKLMHLRGPAALGPVIEAGEPLEGMPLLPGDQRRLGHSDSLHDLVRPDAFVG